MTVSVIIPTFNEEQNIESCLASLRRQRFADDDVEIIVVDGNSADKTREIAEKLADKVIIQTSRKVGGARNDGAMIARGDVIATTDADCIIPADWLQVIHDSFAATDDLVQLYGTVYPREPGLKHRVSLGCANTFSALGYHTRTLYYTLGCNTAFNRDAFVRAGMYRCIDAGDDLEIAQRMRKIGRVMFNPKMRVQFSMRRYEQFGTIKSLYEWVYIVAKGGSTTKYSYSKREYK
ncbi:MAG: glycosyltransferase [Methanomicrobiales archaeon]|nr:glycosyltransferase [Methanomicrobiales archaeon]